MIGGGSNMAIGISIFLRDNFSANARGVSNSMQQMQGQSQKLQQQQLQATRNLNAAGAAIGVGVLSQMRQWVRSGAEYGYTMKYVTELAKGSEKEIASLDKRAKGLGQTTMFSTAQVADGMRYMAMAGMNAKQIYDNVGAAVNMSIATMTELGGKGGGADIMTNIMSAFQIGSEHANRVADIMTTATTSANINLFDLGESFKYAAATSRDLNVGLEETAAMIMMAGNAGIQGSMAGTAIENMLRYITTAAGGESKKRNEALAMLGLSPKDLRTAEGNLKPVGELMTLIGNQAKQLELGGVDMQNIYATLFGVRGKREGSLMLRNMADYHKFLNTLNVESQGSAERIAGNLMDTPMGRMKQFTDTLENLKIAFTEALVPVIIPLLQVLTKLLQGLTAIMESGFGKFLTIVATGFIVWKTVAMGYRAVQASIKLLNVQIGSTFGNAATQVVGGYARMTAAANAYGAAAARSSMANSVGMRGMSNVRWQAGQFMATGPGGGNIFLGKNANMRAVNQRYAQIYGRPVGFGRQVATGLAGAGQAASGWLGKIKPGNLLKGGGLGAGLAGMGLQMAGDAVGGNVGQGIGVAGSTLSMAGTGAMIGSIIPGVGTAIGAVAGGLLGLTMGIMDWQDASEENTDALNANTNSNEKVLATPSIHDAAYWQSRLKMMDQGTDVNSVRALMLNKGTKENDTVLGTNTRYGGEAWNLPGGNQTIVINVDGEEALNKQIDKKMRSNNIELGLGL